MTDDRFPSEKQDKFLVRLPDGMRDRIKYAADANGRSMNAEIVAALHDVYPDPTPREYLQWLFKALEENRETLSSPNLPDSLRPLNEKYAVELRQRMLEVIDGTSDEATFAAEIASLSDFHAVKRDKPNIPTTTPKPASGKKD